MLGEVVDRDLADIEMTAEHGQTDRPAAARQRAEASPGRPEQAVVTINLRREGQPAGNKVRLQTGESIDELPCRHGSRIIGTTFNIVPWIASASVMSIARAAYNLHTFLDQSVHDHVRGRHIFNSRPDLFSVGCGHHRLPNTLRVSRDQQTRLILKGIVPAGIEMIPKRRPEVVGMDRRQGRPDLAGFKKAADPGYFRMPLPKDLIGNAAFAHLVFQL